LLDFDTGKWTFKVSEKDAIGPVDVSKNGTIRAILGLEGDTTGENWTSDNSVTTAVKTTLSYKRKK